jgi:NADPH-dependent curcumin reductase CurA
MAFFVRLILLLQGNPLSHFVPSRVAFVEYAVVEDTSDFRVIENEEKLPLTLYVGLAGMPGKTAWMGWKELSSAKSGETVFVSGGAGPVGS